MDKTERLSKARPSLISWIIVGWVGFCILPWYAVEDGFLSFAWLFDGYPIDPDYAPAAVLILQGEKLWLLPLLLPLAISLFALWPRQSDARRAVLLILVGSAGIAWMAMQGFGIGIRGFNFDWLTAVFGELGDRQVRRGLRSLPSIDRVPVHSRPRHRHAWRHRR